jgi:exosortase A-associated hydrolase 2
VHAACDWLTGQHPGVPLWLWGQRSGALLASAAAAARPQPTHLLLWQPVLAGRTLVQQLQRLSAAAHLGDPTASKLALAALREAVAEGRSVEVAGYTIRADLMTALEAATLTMPAQGRVVWLELSSRAGAELSPAARKTVDAWQQAGLSVQAAVVEGPAFWQAVEIEQAPQLIDATVPAVLGTTGVPA